MNIHSRRAGVIVLPFISLTAFAQVSASEPEGRAGADSDLDTITVIGTRTERTLKEIGASISVISSDDIEREIIRDIADLVRYEPGVSVGGGASRFGLDGFTIRGIGGNRVLTMVDGIRVPDEFGFGPFLSARRDFVDVDSLERAEIARGPSSPLYGSDAIGGVVAFTTRSPSSFLDDDRPYYASFKAGYDGADDGMTGTLTFAGAADALSGMVVYTHRDASETDNQGSVGGTGSSRTAPNPADAGSDNVIAKIVYQASEAHRFTLGVDYFDGETEVELLSDLGPSAFGPITTERRDATDTRNRSRVSLHYDFDGDLAFANRIRVTAYTQQAENEQFTDEDRTVAGVPEARNRLSLFDQDIEGAYLQLGKDFEIGGSKHVLTYGLEYYTTESAALRGGASFDTGGNQTAGILTRDFPITETEQLAFFVQDEISLLDNRLLVTPSLRYDSYDANATADSIYLEGNPGTPLPADYDDSEVTGRLSLVYAFTENVSGYAQYSEGFRAPPYDDVNVGFTNVAGGYKTISNPNLTAERSEGFEVGIRLQGGAGSATLAAFQTDYDDFIQSFTTAPEFLPTGVDPADGLFTFQSINTDKVEIDGIEFSGHLNLAVFNDNLDGFSLRTALAYADGEDVIANEPITSIEPFTAVVGASYDAANERWGTELIVTHVDGKDQSDIGAADPRIETDSYSIVDLLAYARFNDRISLNVGLFNLTDETYIRWADAPPPGGESVADRYTQPGFNAGATLRVEF